MTANATPTSGSAKPKKVVLQQIGWMFVRQFYTTLNKNPEDLHRFYGKESSLIRGREGEEVVPCFGQEEIHANITKCNFSDCKVLVENVDAMASLNGSVFIQVLGKLANNNGPSQNFAQSFYLAEQPNGYYVLNDIFRFLKDEDDVEAEETETPAAVTASQPQETPAAPAKAAAPAPAKVTPEPVQPKAEAKTVTPAPSAPATETPAAPTPSATTTAAAPAAKPAAVAQAAEAVDSSSTPAVTSEAKPTSAGPWKTNAWGGAGAKQQAAQGKTAAATDSKSASAAAANTATPATQQPAAAPAAPVKEEPAAPKSWANMAAKNTAKWGSNVADVKGVVSSTTSPRPAQAGPGSKPEPKQGDHAAAAKPRHDRNDEFTVFVKGVGESITKKALTDFFSEVGPVKGVEIMQPRGHAYVDFAAAEPYRKALETGSYKLGSSNLQVEEKLRRTSSGPRHGGGHPHRRGSPTNSRDFGPSSGNFNRRGGLNGRGGGAPKPPRSNAPAPSK
ncbi:hypothetical protein IWQ60_004871 [Tieghemiomyces parasiticus]|uniref:Uncharacterized protein n=1 Tax=Tieghemiomyces parasiticus TaxID=78921 RepID=A0A9W8A7D1_9FUNG|nr:hypothetical protein IWQ60_004871 [Tieghemiomyces parasiticus]